MTVKKIRLGENKMLRKKKKSFHEKKTGKKTFKVPFYPTQIPLKMRLIILKGA